jgi:uncharacterized protein
VRVVLDTNVLLSAAITFGTGHKVVMAGVKEAIFEVLICNLQLQELRDVMLRPSKHYQFSAGIADGYLTVLYNEGILTGVLSSGIRHTRDPKDDYMVDLAIQGEADVLVSNDQHLLELHEIVANERLIPVVTARQFLTHLERSGLLKPDNGE